MSGTCKSGFTLIEIIITVAVVALLATVVVPSLQRRTPEQERLRTTAELNSLVAHAAHQAIISNKIYKVLFNLPEKRVELHAQTDKRDDKGAWIFEPTRGMYVAQKIVWPASLTIKQFLVEGSDLMARFVGSKSEQVWFFVVPEGLAQTVTINLLDTKDRVQSKPRPVSLVLNPFSAQFTVYDTFQN